ncbi:hypothetical protein [Brucella anthropi]|uniref:hypothetical protein n=1 Tax=Brucella anthropi TaxID=529 RepID=UPI00244D2829|nr:hypothetical protein [Brucella anthropi]MDG9792432.1 hypothetical protein [Brucella anthropi]MDH0582304.1 hypothetical protein [Brucella anthropi]MDH0819157.1 hypothetical protein [Brucella anthropi]MDH2085661.1 hypothetical protein [Brucella anthropi]
MASKSMALDVVVRLRDMLTGPMNRLRSGLQKLTGFARKIGRFGNTKTPSLSAAYRYWDKVREAQKQKSQWVTEPRG